MERLASIFTGPGASEVIADVLPCDSAVSHDNFFSDNKNWKPNADVVDT